MTGQILAIGESLGLVVAAEVGRPLRGDVMKLTFGGAESNVAIGVSRLGGKAAWVGRLGADTTGDLIVRELSAEGVHVHVTRDAEVPTSLMMKSRPRPGATSVSFYRRGLAGSRLQVEDLPLEAIRAASVLHVTGISAVLSDTTRATVLAAIDEARAAGVLVSFDVNHRASLVADVAVAARHYRDFAARADYIFAGDDEAEILTGETENEAQLGALLAFGARAAVVKLGEHGALGGTAEGEVVPIAAISVNAVDTVGAGDAFVAGFLTESVRGLSLTERLQTAVACGAFACLVNGDWEAAATRADLAAFVSGADPVAR